MHTNSLQRHCGGLEARERENTKVCDESAPKDLRNTTHVATTADTRGQGQTSFRGQSFPCPIVFATKLADKATQTAGAADTRGSVTFQHGVSIRLSPASRSCGPAVKHTLLRLE